MTLSIKGKIKRGNRIPARVRQGDEGLASTGFVEVIGVDYKTGTIRLAFYSDTSDWSSLLRGKSIRDIDLSDYVHEYDEPTIVSSWSNERGYIYPLIDYNNLTKKVTARDTSIEDWFPAVYSRTIVERIFRAIGWKVSGSFVNSWRYLREVVPMTNKTFEISEEYARNYKFIARGSVAQTFTASGSYPASTPVSVDNYDSVPFTSAQRDYFSAISLPSGTWTAPATLVNVTFLAKFKGVSASVISDDINGSFEVVAEIVKNGGVVGSTPILVGSGTTPPGGQLFSGPITLSATTDITSGDVIEMRIRQSYSNSGPAFPATYSSSISYQSSALRLSSLDRTILPGGDVTLENNLPDVSQSDFILDLAVRYGLLISTDSETRTVYLDPFEEVLNKIGDAPDWTDYIDIGDDRELDFSESFEYAQRNVFLYSSPGEDDLLVDEYNRDRRYPLASGLIDIDRDYLEAEKEVHTSPFCPTFQVVTGGLSVPSIPIYDDDDERTIDPGARLLYVIRDTDPEDWSNVSSILIEGSSYGASSGIPYAYFFKVGLDSALDQVTADLSFGPVDVSGRIGEGLLETYYRTLARVVSDPVILTIGAVIPSHVYRSFDFRTPVRIDTREHRGVYYVEEISGYRGSSVPCKVKLVKLA